MTDARVEGLRLETVPGVGPALARRIRSAYGDDAGFLEACRRLDLDRLLTVEGLSERRAFDLVAAVRGAEELAATDRAREARRDLEDLLSSYARTAYGRRYLRLLPVLRDPAKIRAHTAHVLAMRDLVERVDHAAVSSALARLGRFKDAPRASLRRLLVVETEDQELELRRRGLDRWCRVASGPTALREVPGYDLCLYLADEGTLPLDDAPNVARVGFDEPLWKAVPETETGFATANRSVLEAMAELGRLLDRPSVAPRVLQAMEGVAESGPADVEAIAEESLTRAQEAFKARVASLSLNGDQILELLGSTTPKILQDARRSAVEAGRAVLRARLGRDTDPFQPGLPLRLDEEEVARLKEEVASRGVVDAFERAVDAARVVQSAQAALRDELLAWFQFDADFALGRYALEFHAVPASTSHRLRFEGGINLRLARKGRAEPVSYELGAEHPVAVLTGANSGGKSSLLELCSQFVLLHHWGLPVPATLAEVPMLDELLLFGAARAADAGAFETFLRELFPPITRPGRKLVLLDEVESMTELEAAGRILGVFLDEVARTGSLCVLVTHLPNEVLLRTRTPVRVDGIDAVGLDEQFNLIVDRQPKLNHRARSTPELILRRVHAKTTGRVREVYGRILDRWTDAT